MAGRTQSDIARSRAALVHRSVPRESRVIDRSGSIGGVDFPSPVPRRVTKPGWFDLRLVLGVVLVLASVLLGATLISGARHTDKEVAATRNLAAGTTLRADDLQLIDVQLRDKRAYLGDEGDAVGKILTQPMTRGALVPAAALGIAPPRTTLTVPFAAHAAPQLSRGQRIILWLSTTACPSVVLLAEVTVQDAHAAGSGAFASTGGGQDVVMSLVPALADRVVGALAIKDATIRAGVLTGGAGASTQHLPSLAECGPPSPSSSP